MPSKINKFFAVAALLLLAASTASGARFGRSLATPPPVDSFPGIYAGPTSPWGDPIGANAAIPISFTVNKPSGWYGINLLNGGFDPAGLVAGGAGVIAGRNISVATSGVYTFTLTTTLVNVATNGPTEGLTRLSVDQIPLEAANDSGVYTFNCHQRSPSTCTMVWKGSLLAGNHLLTINMTGGGNTNFATSMVIALQSSGLPLEPAGSRSAALQPMSSYSIYNTAIGSGATWSAPTDLDTKALTTGTYGVINSSCFSLPLYLGQASDPQQQYKIFDVIYEPAATVANVHMPVGMTVACGSDEELGLYDATQPRWWFTGFQGIVTASPGQPGISVQRGQISDNCNGWNNAIGQGSSQFPGLIRGWEVAAGAINHIMIIGLPNQLMAPVATAWTPSTISTFGYTNGIAYPAWEADYNGAFGQYGSNFAITNAANNGSGLIRITLASAGQYTGQLVTGRVVKISNVVGTTEANGEWTITVINNTTFDLQGSTFSNAYVSGGTSLSAGIQYGSTFGIPSTVNINSLGLSAGGLILAKALQDYGAYNQITGGSPNPQLTLYHERDTSLDTVLFGQMQTAWNTTLVPLLRIMRNQTPLTIGGGGTPRQPMQAGLAACH